MLLIASAWKIGIIVVGIVLVVLSAWSAWTSSEAEQKSNEEMYGPMAGYYEDIDEDE